jgi:hypothetical protein
MVFNLLHMKIAARGSIRGGLGLTDPRLAFLEFLAFSVFSTWLKIPIDLCELNS